VTQRELRLTPERQTCVGRNDAARGALQQTRGQFAFETADLLTQCRGHHAEFQRCLAHASVFHDAEKIA
jgi:hypothetical protein